MGSAGIALVIKVPLKVLVVHDFNSLEAKTGGSLQVPGHPGIHKEMLSQNKNQK